MGSKKSSSKRPALQKYPKKKQAEDKAEQAKKSLKHRLLKRKRGSRPDTRKLSGSFRLLHDSWSLVWQNWKLFGGILVVYIVLLVVLVGGLGGLNAQEGKMSLMQFDQAGLFEATWSIFSTMVTSTGSSVSESASAYQTLVIVVVSLATIRGLRQLMAGKVTSVRDVFFNGMYPLVPFMLALTLVGVQIFPVFAGGMLVNVAGSTGFANSVGMQVFWNVLLFALAVLSLYLITASLFALYIVTLPNMGPIQAIRSAVGLVRYRRWTVMRKLLFLPVALLVIGAIITLPAIIFVASFAHWIFILYALVSLIVAHTYIYQLYRELL